MDVRSVAARSVQNFHVVRAVRWASSKTIKDVLSVNVEVSAALSDVLFHPV